MITLWIICVLLGLGMMTASVLIVVVFAVFVVFVLYFFEGISLSVLQGALKKKGKIVNFLPAFRGINEGAMISDLCRLEDRKRSIQKIIFFIGRSAYLTLIIICTALFVEAFSIEKGLIAFMGNTLNALDLSIKQLLGNNFGVLLVLSVLAFYVYATVMRAKSLTALGIHKAISFIISIFISPAWSFVAGIFIRVKKIFITEETEKIVDQI